MSGYSRGPGGPASATGSNGAQIRQRQWGPAGNGNGNGNGGSASGSRIGDDSGQKRRRKLADIDDDEDEEEDDSRRSSSKKNGSSSSSRPRDHDEQRSHKGHGSRKADYGPSSRRSVVTVSDNDEDEQEADRDDDRRRRKHQHRNGSDHNSNGTSYSASTKSSRARKTILDDDDEDEDEIREIPPRHRNAEQEQPSPSKHTPSRSKSTLPQVDRSALEPITLLRKEKPISAGLAAIRAKKAAAGGTAASGSGASNAMRNKDSSIVIPGRTSSAQQGRSIGAGSGIGRPSQATGPFGNKSLTKALPSEVSKLYDPKDLRNRAKASNGDNSIVISDDSDDSNARRSSAVRPRAGILKRPNGSPTKSNGSATSTTNGGRPSISAAADQSDPITIDDDDDEPVSAAAAAPGQRDDDAWRAAWREKKAAEKAEVLAAQQRKEAEQASAAARAGTVAGAGPSSSNAVIESNAAPMGLVTSSGTGFNSGIPTSSAISTLATQTFSFSEFMAPQAFASGSTAAGIAPSIAISNNLISESTVPATLDLNAMANSVDFASFFTNAAGSDVDMASVFQALGPGTDANVNNDALSHDLIAATTGVGMSSVPALALGGDLVPGMDGEQDYGDAADALFQDNTGGFLFGADDGDNAMGDSFELLGGGGDHHGEEQEADDARVAEINASEDAHQNVKQDSARGAMVDVAIPAYDSGLNVSGATSAGATASNEVVTGSAPVSVSGPSADGSQLSAAGHAQNPNETIPETMYALFPEQEEDDDDDENQPEERTPGKKGQQNPGSSKAMAMQAETDSNPGYGTMQLSSPEGDREDQEQISDAEPAGDDDDDDDDDDQQKQDEEARERGDDGAGDRDAGQESVRTLNGKQKEINAARDRFDTSDPADSMDMSVATIKGRNGGGTNAEDEDEDDESAWGNLENYQGGDDEEELEGEGEGGDEEEEEYDEEGYEEEEDEEMEEVFDPRNLQFGLNLSGQGQSVPMNEVWDDATMNDAWDTGRDEYEIFHAQKQAAIAASKEGKAREEQERAAAEAAADLQRKYSKEAAQTAEKLKGKSGKRKAGETFWKDSARPGSKAAKQAARQQAAQARRKAEIAQQAAEAAYERAEAQKEEKRAKEAQRLALKAQVEAEEREQVQAEAEEARLRAKASMLEKKAVAKAQQQAQQQAQAQQQQQQASGDSARGSKDQTPDVVAIDKRLGTTTTSEAPASSSGPTNGSAAASTSATTSTPSPTKVSRVPVRPAAQVFAVAAPKVRAVVPANALEQEQLAKEEELMQLAASSQSSSLLPSGMRVTGMGGVAGGAGKQHTAWRQASKAVAKTPNRIGGEVKGKGKGIGKAGEVGEEEEQDGAYVLKQDETSFAKTLEEMLRQASAAAAMAFKPAFPTVDASASASASSGQQQPADKLTAAHSDMVTKMMLSMYWTGYYSQGVQHLSDQIKNRQQQQQQQQQQHPSASGSGSGPGPSGSH